MDSFAKCQSFPAPYRPRYRLMHEGSIKSFRIWVSFEDEVPCAGVKRREKALLSREFITRQDQRQRVQAVQLLKENSAEI